MPRRWACAGGASVQGSPCRMISPEVGSSAPARIFTSVDLPAPLSPTSPTMSPWWRSTERLRNAWIAPKALVIRRRLTSGAPAAPAAMSEIVVSAAGIASSYATERDRDDQQAARKQVLREDRRADHGEAVIA